MPYYLVIIDKEFKIGSKADYTFGVNTDIEKFIDWTEIGTKFDCEFRRSICHHQSCYLEFDNINNLENWLATILLSNNFV